VSGEIAVRPARDADAEAMARIFREGIEDRVATLRRQPPSAQAIAELARGPEPVLVAERGGEVAGWARVAPYDPVNAYYASVGEATIYVARALRGQGIGSALLERLCAEAESAGFHKLTGKIFTGNEASVALFARHGWTSVGVHRRHGRLDGE
jgi:phosphinothricin acetyltransferase